MNICFLGAHNVESQETGFTCLLFDGVLAIDAGALTANLSFAAQRALKAVLLTHGHYDHLRDVPALAMTFYLSHGTLNLYSIRETYEDLVAYLLNGRLYPNFFERPAEDPAVRFTSVEPYRPEHIAGYAVLPVPVNHGVPAVGYQITSPEGKTVLYTGDTGHNLTECWQHVSPRLLVIELTLPNEHEKAALTSGHMTPALLKEEMLAFQKVRGYIPQIVTVHMNPDFEPDIESQLADVAEALNTPITLAYEGMQLQV